MTERYSLTPFEIARHREANRNKILHAFENLPNVIQIAQGRAETLSLDNRMESIRLHESVNELQQTLLRTLPDLIEKLNPGTFRELLALPP